jgi:tetratricopeptide (TPR) repeat protein
MYHRICVFLLIAAGGLTPSLFAQQPCPGFTVAVGTHEDHLLLAINGADNPQEQLKALDEFVQDNPDSKFLPCVNEYYASTHLKLNNFDKSIEYAEKDLAANYQDLNLFLTLVRAYASSSKVSDTVFEILNKIPDQAKAETSTVMRPAKATEEEWEKMQKDNTQLIKDSRAVAIWAFFQVTPRVAEPAKRVQLVDTFLKTYPEVEKDNAPQVYNIYFLAYQQQGNVDKTVEYGDKVIAADPNDVGALNTLGLIYAFYSPHPSPEKAADYARKALTVAEGLKKPEGLDEATFKKEQTNQLGIAHMTLGYAALARAERTTKLAPAIEELKTAAALLGGKPELQCQALYYLAFAYERGYPANHRGAMEALEKAVDLPGPFQAQARDLLAKVRAAVKQ